MTKGNNEPSVYTLVTPLLCFIYGHTRARETKGRPIYMYCKNKN